MGDKTEARKAAGECGVPVIPGTKGSITNAQEALDFARSVGLPVMLKAAYGGGGRGMRVVRAGQFSTGIFDEEPGYNHSPHIEQVHAWHVVTGG